MPFEGRAFVARRSLAWVLALAPLSSLLLIPLAISPGASIASLFLGAAVVALMSALVILRIPIKKSDAPRSFAADARGLSLEGRLAIPRRALRRAYLGAASEGSHAVHVDARFWRRSATLYVESAEDAGAIVDALALDREQAVSRFDALPPWAHRMRWLAVLLTTSPWVLFNLLRHVSTWGIGLVLGAYALIALPVLLPQRLEIGDDGISLRWLGKRRFIPFSSIEAARATPLGLELDLTGERTFEIRLTHQADGASARRDAILRRIHEGLAGRSDARLEEQTLLARGERDLATWVREVRALGAPSAGGYRALAIPRERLWAVLESPSADPSAREGAAIALHASLDRDERKRLLAAARSTAAPRVRVTIDAAATSPDEERLRVALEAEEELVDRAPSTRARAAKPGA